MAVTILNKSWLNKPPVGSQINWGHSLSKGITGCWPMNDVTGRIKNYHDNSLGIPTNTYINLTNNGLATIYDGSTSKIIVGNKSLLRPTNFPFSFSISFVVNSLAAKNVLYSNDNRATNYSGMEVSTTTSGNIEVRLGNNGGAGASNRNSFNITTGININKLYNLTFTIFSLTEATMFLNGEYYLVTHSGTASTFLYSTGTAAFGRPQVNADTTFLNGDIICAYFWDKRVLNNNDAIQLYLNPYQFIATPKRRFYFIPSGATATLSGTVTTATETDIVNGSKTIILTLTGDTWIAAGALSFDLQRQAIINGLVSAQSELFGWNNVVLTFQSVAGVVRTSDTIVTITLDAEATYNITASETITSTIPASALNGANAIVATPTFTISPVGAVLGIMNLKTSWWGDL